MAVMGKCLADSIKWLQGIYGYKKERIQHLMTKIGKCLYSCIQLGFVIIRVCLLASANIFSIIFFFHFSQPKF